MDALLDEVNHCPEDDAFAAHQDEYEMLPSMAVPEIDRDAFQELWQENLPVVSVLQRSIEAGKEFIHVKTGCAEEVARVRSVFTIDRSTADWSFHSCCK